MAEITCHGLLFDLDGVLIDSTPAVTRVWARWAAEHGFDPAEVVRKAHGRPSIMTIREFLPSADADVENQKVERAELEDLDGVVPLPGARELLSALPADRWTIVTSCTRPLAEVRLQAAGLSIPANIITASDVKNGKPDPEPYLKGAVRLGFPVAECVVVEDAPAGVRAGKSAGSRVVALTTTAAPEELRHAKADWIVENCRSLTVGRVSRQDGLTLTLANDRG
jgi:sugar-phosphatase